ncbi:phosphatase PAP2 family protein [Cohnella rhizosphaerae]|uniref:Phosphatase PAP2 family protein n=1 Tax=Cohnella rhizosphaerae TaxID=1457232 RepID=A0A9X4KYR2_9BACL|nr:phosphatase PAP2 family protein [Cohnella rhizosphaerae]MDG0812851.1 phosphatase PAP2 family protein [Cohnella rhizosphaerae]
MLVAACSALVLAIGASRIYLGVHYPSDVIGGYLASGFWLTSTIWAYRRYDRHRDRG